LNGIFRQKLRHFNRDGFLIMKNAVDLRELGQAKKSFYSLLNKQKKLATECHFEVPIPLREPFLSTQIIANPHVLKLLFAQSAGSDCYLWLFNANTALPGCADQAVHRDLPHLFPIQENAHQTANWIVSIPLDPFRPSNGSTELWPGSHLIQDPVPQNYSFDQSMYFSKDRWDFGASAVERKVRSSGIRPEQVRMNLGDLIIRDARVWHRGKSNLENDPRSMLTLVYNRGMLNWDPVQKITKSKAKSLSPTARLLMRKMIVSKEDTRDLSSSRRDL